MTNPQHSPPAPRSSRFLGYATAEADSDPIMRSLRPIDPNNAPLYIPEIHLVEITINRATGELTWTTVKSFPLSGT